MNEPEPLFEIPDGARVQKPAPQPTTLPERQMAKMRRGAHPLSMPGWPLIWLHKDAPPPDDRDTPGPRCGTCVFREFLLSDGYHGKRVPKCVLTDHRGRRSRAAHSVASDVRGWWPACRDYQAKAPDGADEKAP